MKTEENEQPVELRSEEFQEILGAVPHWILRWGIMALAAVVAVLITGSALFKYPDVIPAEIILTGTTPPANIVARTSGKLKELFVADNQDVRTGDFLAVIDNPAKTEDVLRLKALLQDSSSRLTPDSPRLTPLVLGDLQAVYASYSTALFNYMEYRRLLYYENKKTMTGERIAQYEEQYQNLLKQYRLIEEQADLQQKQYRRDIKLNETGIVSAEELEKSRSQYLQSELSLENMKSSLNSMRIQIAQLKESLFDAGYQDTEKLNGLNTQLAASESQLVTALKSWELTYVFTAPVDGKITFTKYWTENQNVSAGEEVFSIVPKNTREIIGKALLPVARSGKVKAGQRVNIHLQNFPENEYGTLRGAVRNVSLVPQQQGQAVFYTVEISLPGQLKTTYGKELPLLPTMQGQADIVTEDISLLERFVLPLKRILKENE